MPDAAQAKKNMCGSCYIGFTQQGGWSDIYSFYFFILVFISRENVSGQPDKKVLSQRIGLYFLEFHIYVMLCILYWLLRLVTNNLNLKTPIAKQINLHYYLQVSIKIPTWRVFTCVYKISYLEKFLLYDKMISRDYLMACRIVHFTHLTVRREIKSFWSDVSTPTSKGRSGNRNQTYFLFCPY